MRGIGRKREVRREKEEEEGRRNEEEKKRVRKNTRNVGRIKKKASFLFKRSDGEGVSL